MASRVARTSQQSSSNLGPVERWVSILGGLGLAAAAARRGPLARRAGFGIAGASLLARGATRYCPMKAAATGQASLGAGFAEQARRAGAMFGGGLFKGGAAEITSMHDMHLAELQELHSVETQLETLLPEMAAAAHNVRLRQRLSDYATEIRSRRAVIESHIRQHGGDAREHPDQAMQALATEARKMTTVGGPHEVRDAGLVASFQRILHYRIAGYGTVAAYARSLGETYHGGALAGFADRDKEVDAQLTDLAQTIINPAAAAQSDAAADRTEQDGGRRQPSAGTQGEGAAAGAGVS